jgi:hypothetical protein
MKHVAIMTLALAFAGTIGVSHALKIPKPVNTGIVGGPGGAPFFLSCPNEGSLVGLYLRFTHWIEQLDAICVSTNDGRWNGSPARALSNSYNAHRQHGAALGGTGGATETTIVCSRDSVVYGLNVETTVPPGGAIDMVGRVEIHCVDPKTGREDIVTPIPRPEGAEYTARWPADCRSQTGRWWANGIVGRAGVYIDAIGLRCAPHDAPPRGPRKEQIESSPILPSPQSTPLPGSMPSPKERFESGGSMLPKPPPKYLPPPEERTGPDGSTSYMTPMIENDARKLGYLDWCRDWGVDCGKPAADAFCKMKGHGPSRLFTKAEDHGHTVVLASRKTCDQPHCDAFAVIVCEAALGAGAKGRHFDRPLAKSGARLHLCLRLPDRGCGWDAADTFCRDKGFKNAASKRHARERVRAETWLGDVCNKRKCRVFTEITCEN